MSAKEKVYLYSRWRGKFEVLEGRVEFPQYSRGRGRFVYKQGRKEKYIYCGIYDGVVSNRVVWLTERDDDHARKLFIEYDEDCIQELEEKIERHKQNIKMLRAEQGGE